MGHTKALQLRGINSKQPTGPLNKQVKKGSTELRNQFAAPFFNKNGFRDGLNIHQVKHNKCVNRRPDMEIKGG